MKLNDNYVDYTPRRIGTKTILNQEQVPNGLTFSKERKSNFYHKLAQDTNYNQQDYMDSPIVRRHFGINEKVFDINTNEINHIHHLHEDIVQKDSWTIDDFHVGQNIGSGKFGTVYIAREKRSNHVVAIKILKKKELEEATVVPFLKREIEIQGHLNHPNITRLYGYFHDKERIYLVLEYAGDSDLYTCLSSFKRFTEQETVNYILEIVDALSYMHKLGVFHRDLKLENILISKEGTLKIADFGWAVFDPHPRRNTFCGTLDYLPPEMIQNQSHNESVDTWALGIICYELLVGKPPFEREDAEESHEATYKRIIEAQVYFPDHISSLAQAFILKLLQKDPSKRLAMSKIEQDPWIRKYAQ